MNDKHLFTITTQSLFTHKHCLSSPSFQIATSILNWYISRGRPLCSLCTKFRLLPSVGFTRRHSNCLPALQQSFFYRRPIRRLNAFSGSCLFIPFNHRSPVVVSTLVIRLHDYNRACYKLHISQFCQTHLTNHISKYLYFFHLIYEIIQNKIKHGSTSNNEQLSRATVTTATMIIRITLTKIHSLGKKQFF